MIVYHNNKYYKTTFKKDLLCGQTTGATSALAAKAAILFYFGAYKNNITCVGHKTAKGFFLHSKVDSLKKKSKNTITATLTKLSGSENDATNLAKIQAVLTFYPISTKTANKSPLDIIVTGGNGVGIVTKTGLNIKVGSSAITKEPLLEIQNAVAQVAKYYKFFGKIQVKICVENGRQIAKHTMNEKLGIVNGISILGTTGIQEPQSISSLKESIFVELNQVFIAAKQSPSFKKNKSLPPLLCSIAKLDDSFFLMFPAFKGSPKIECSNLIGDALLKAISLGFRQITLVGGAGKLIKLSGGITNTHSYNADCRLELLCAAGVLCGAPLDILKKILQCTTTNAAFALLKEYSLQNKSNLLDDVLQCLGKKIHSFLNTKLQTKAKIDVILQSTVFDYFIC